MSLFKDVHQGLSRQVMEEAYSYDQRYTSWNPPPYQHHVPPPPYTPSQGNFEDILQVLRQERNEIMGAQRKIEIQLDLKIKLATLVIEHLTNSQPSKSGNFPSQQLSNPWGSIGTVFLCTNQEGREDALLDKEDVEKPKGMEIVHSASSEVTPSKLPSELQFEWVDLPNLNFIGPQHYALLETDDQLGALGEVLDKKEEDLVELDSRFNAYSEHLYKLHNNRAKVGAFSLRKRFGLWQFQEKLGWTNQVWDPGKSFKYHHFWGVITCVGAFRDLLNMNRNPLEPKKFKHWWRFKDEFKHKPP
ncbi:hypothetical protein PIB30_083970 [Stylosanthes scabra]|uniref:Uncharacterized protein n=1 Tax=Stylosanthes scabra TaxID=79078 RepID=A0ABU6RT07_9FABA|nr:hypothetical protein [Stylosanthes scabra]